MRAEHYPWKCRALAPSSRKPPPRDEPITPKGRTMNRSRLPFSPPALAAVAVTGLILAAPPAGRADGADERVLRKEVTVHATLDEVWDAWTTPEGVASFFAPKSKIEIRVGGPYELYFILDAPPGQRGCEGCRVLSYLPKEMLSFEWLAPPSIPALRDAGKKTHVVLRFTEEPPGAGCVRVELTQLGWGEGDDWDKCYKYFDGAWGYVMGNLHKRFAPAPTPPDSPGPTTAPAHPGTNPLRRADTAKQATHLKPLARLIDGVWHCKTQEPNGITLQAKLDYEWGIQKNAVITRSFLVHDNQEDMIHQTFYVWHPHKKNIVFWSVSGWGTLYEGVVVPEGDTLTYRWRDYRNDTVKSMQQNITFLDDDTYEWTVFAETPEGREQIQQATFHRRPE